MIFINESDFTVYGGKVFIGEVPVGPFGDGVSNVQMNLAEDSCEPDSIVMFVNGKTSDTEDEGIVLPGEVALIHFDVCSACQPVCGT